MAGMADGGRGFGKSVMVSRLPLIFSRGRPCSVDKLDGDALVDFVRFMLRCSLGVEESSLKTIKRPYWWPRTMPYFNFNAKKEIKKGHAGRLRELVARCYEMAECGYLLQLADRLSQLFDYGSLHLVTNYDGTTALCETGSNRLVVSCRNENVNYDKPGAVMTSPRRLMPTFPLTSGRPGTGRASGMVRPPPPCDIFLCDNCTAEFASIAEVRLHERVCSLSCGGVSAAEDGKDVCEPETSSDGAGMSDTSRRKTFFNYLGLVDAADSTAKPSVQPTAERHLPEPSGNSRVRRLLRARVPLFLAMHEIDISSPLGRRLVSRQPECRVAGTRQQQLLACRHEIYCCSKTTHVTGPLRFPISWRPARPKRRGVEVTWHHSFCFNRRQRLERLRVIKTGLSRRSWLIFKRLKPCYIRVQQLSLSDSTQPSRHPPHSATTISSIRPRAILPVPNLTSNTTRTTQSGVVIAPSRVMPVLVPTPVLATPLPLTSLPLMSRPVPRLLVRLPQPTGRVLHTDSGTVVDLCSSDSDGDDPRIVSATTGVRGAAVAFPVKDGTAVPSPIMRGAVATPPRVRSTATAFAARGGGAVPLPSGRGTSVLSPRLRAATVLPPRGGAVAPSPGGRDAAASPPKVCAAIAHPPRVRGANVASPARGGAVAVSSVPSTGFASSSLQSGFGPASNSSTGAENFRRVGQTIYTKSLNQELARDSTFPRTFTSCSSQNQSKNVFSHWRGLDETSTNGSTFHSVSSDHIAFNNAPSPLEVCASHAPRVVLNRIDERLLGDSSSDLSDCTASASPWSPALPTESCFHRRDNAGKRTGSYTAGSLKLSPCNKLRSDSLKKTENKYLCLRFSNAHCHHCLLFLDTLSDLGLFLKGKSPQKYDKSRGSSKENTKQSLRTPDCTSLRRDLYAYRRKTRSLASICPPDKLKKLELVFDQLDRVISRSHKSKLFKAEPNQFSPAKVNSSCTRAKDRTPSTPMRLSPSSAVLASCVRHSRCCSKRRLSFKSPRPSISARGSSESAKLFLDECKELHRSGKLDWLLRQPRRIMRHISRRA